MDSVVRKGHAGLLIHGLDAGQRLDAQPLRPQAVAAGLEGLFNDDAGPHHTGITKAMEALGMDVDKQLFIVDEVPEDDTQVGAAVDTLVG